jgi:hypothetical protein
MNEYCLMDFMNDNQMRGLLAGHDTTPQRLRLSVDANIPASSIGYVSQLCSDEATRIVQLDAARQLAPFVIWYGGIPVE